MVKTVFIIHGSYGSPRENWFPWLKEKLLKNGFKVLSPQFPIPPKSEQNEAWGGHDLDKWLNTIQEYQTFIDENAIFVAHSRGCILCYRLLPKLQRPIFATFLVAPWKTYHWYTPRWNETDSFHKRPFDWKRIRNGSKRFEVYQSTNDDTPVSEGKDIAKKLGAKLFIVENAGHFNTSSGFKTFPLLLENILRMTDNNPQNSESR